MYDQLSALTFSIEGKVKEIMHKAFWDALEASISEDPPNYRHACVLIQDVKEVMIFLCLIIVKKKSLKMHSFEMLSSP